MNQTLKFTGPFAVSRDEWDVILSRRSNVLLEGDESGLEAVIIALTPHVRPSVLHWAPGCRLTLPDASHATLLLKDVDHLSTMEQALLYAWMNDGAHRRVQIVSTSPRSLYSLVQQGVFLENLYYCLNTFYLDLTAQPERAFGQPSRDAARSTSRAAGAGPVSA
jgi:Sigma-54 interaction domain